MKKIMSIILICLFAFTLFSCEVDESKKTYHWEFEKDYTHVTEIKVVIPPEGESFDINTCKVIKEIDISHASELMEDIEWITMRRQQDNANEPSQLCILIMFDNGEYDVIARKGSSHYKYDENGTIQRHFTGLEADPSNFLGIVSYWLAAD